MLAVIETVEIWAGFAQRQAIAEVFEYAKFLGAYLAFRLDFGMKTTIFRPLGNSVCLMRAGLGRTTSCYHARPIGTVD